MGRCRENPVSGEESCQEYDNSFGRRSASLVDVECAVLKKMTDVQATDFRNGTIAVRLQQFHYLIAKREIVEQQTSEIR